MTQDIKVQTGEVQTPYQEISNALTAGQIDKILLAHAYFRLLSLTGDMQIRFNGSGSFTSIVGAGIGIDLNEAVAFVEIYSPSGCTYTIALSMGKIFDDRLNVVGNLNVASSQANPLFTTSTGNTIFSTALAAVAAGGTQTLLASNATTRSVTVKNPSTSGGPVRLGGAGTGATNGLLLEEGESITLETTATIAVFNPNTFTVQLSFVAIRN